MKYKYYCGKEEYNYLRGWDCTSAMATTTRVYYIMLIANRFFGDFYLFNTWCFAYNLSMWSFWGALQPILGHVVPSLVAGGTKQNILSLVSK